MNPTAILLVITVVLIVVVAVACIGSYLYASEPAPTPSPARFGEPWPNWDWNDIRWCQYCDDCRGHVAMEFDDIGRYICSTCLCSEHLEAPVEQNVDIETDWLRLVNEISNSIMAH